MYRHLPTHLFPSNMLFLQNCYFSDCSVRLCVTQGTFNKLLVKPCTVPYCPQCPHVINERKTCTQFVFVKRQKCQIYLHSNIFFAPAWHTVLSVDFRLSRHIGYFLINVYVPCCLLVILSWVAFWINREATADRIALGETVSPTNSSKQ